MTTAVNQVVDRIAADVRQLVDPIHAAVRGRVITHDPLLDQLREACAPSSGVRSEARRPAPGSRPPARLDVLEVHAAIYVGVAEWRVRLSLGSPPRDADWQKAVMRLLVAAAPRLDPGMAEWLRVEVEQWWRSAAVGAGWNPRDLLKLR